MPRLALQWAGSRIGNGAGTLILGPGRVHRYEKYVTSTALGVSLERILGFRNSSGLLETVRGCAFPIAPLRNPDLPNLLGLLDSARDSELPLEPSNCSRATTKAVPAAESSQRSIVATGV